ncbi:TetR family transcriptional regulator [Rhodococcus fascians]|uniref:TetR/AcrR family transcriptional regulator n=1 Tax=Rhodococcoides fascians TaxID=1828 RepID=UPI001961F78E|nr:MULTISPECIES: TetR/AcrR family transcriptional regulator [Rhodococcus]MBM7245199.1 TetR family transcriptional regulator [Rhodococcus fascians]MBY3811052.1 TetR family transcriptional regulator [Rhodococcus fascians]MBY3842555.1 TetR family transcriptional regulator [Rhodococcus fascians]MBY3845464.1 TetR family transcriptional regulator [Rhodococcus fascians]MBY3851804.1 TetR family transcriptional regulator [Rhodococcus fascians]
MPIESDDPRQRIPQAVWDTIAELGIEATTVRAVAARAGCTTGLIMHRFGSRSAMLVHARQTLFERTAARADAAGAGQSAAERLYSVVCSVLPLDDERIVEGRIFTGFAAAAIADDELRTPHVTHTRQWLTRIAGLVADLGAHITDALAAECALQIATAVEGVVVLAVLDPETYPPATQKSLVQHAIATVVERSASTDR